MLQKQENTWEHFIFWSRFKTDQEEQSHRKKIDKGKTLIKKLRKKVIVKDEENFRLEEASNQENKNSKFKQRVNENESKTLQSEIKEVEPVVDVILAKYI